MAPTELTQVKRYGGLEFSSPVPPAQEPWPKSPPPPAPACPGPAPGTMVNNIS